MKDQKPTHSLMLTLCTALLLSACSENSDPLARQSGAGPAFAYGDGSELRSPMDELGFQLALLDRELTADEFNDIDQPEVVSILREMELLASSLQAENAGESHLFLQEDMAAFINTLVQARVTASESPPRYYLAGKIAGGCVNCHEVSW